MSTRFARTNLAKLLRLSCMCDLVCHPQYIGISKLYCSASRSSAFIECRGNNYGDMAVCADFKLTDLHVSLQNISKNKNLTKLRPGTNTLKLHAFTARGMQFAPHLRSSRHSRRSKPRFHQPCELPSSFYPP